MTIYIASDHAGYKLKEEIKKSIKVVDLGTNSTDSVDYPDYAKKLTAKLKPTDKGILICGTGTGMSIAANRSKKARAAVVYDTYSAKMARQDNNANIICLRSRNINPKQQIKLVKTFLSTKFSNDSRHKIRINKLK